MLLCCCCFIFGLHFVVSFALRRYLACYQRFVLYIFLFLFWSVEYLMREWSCSDSFDAVSLSHSLSLILVHITVYVYSPLLCTSQQWKLQRTNNLHFHWPQSLSNTHTKNSQNWFHKKKKTQMKHTKTTENMLRFQSNMDNQKFFSFAVAALSQSFFNFATTRFTTSERHC